MGNFQLFMGRKGALIAVFLAFFLVGCAAKTEKNPVPEAVTDHMLNEELRVAFLQQEAAFAKSSQKQTKKREVKTSTPSNPVLQPGMSISLQTVEDEALNGSFQIPFEGPLVLPYNVKLNASGKQLSEFRGDVIRAYRPFFKIKPTMNVGLSNRKRLVEVQGLVNKPGKILVSGTASLDEIISESGGLTVDGKDQGKAQYVRVLSTKGETFNLSLSEYYAGVSSFDLSWKGGDRVFFQSEEPSDLEPGILDRPKVQLLGQVGNPGAYPYQDGQNFFHYLVKAGGPTERTDFRKVEVVTFDSGERHTKKYDLSQKEVVPPVRAGDIVIVHALKDDQTISNVTAILNSVATALIAAVAL